VSYRVTALARTRSEGREIALVGEDAESGVGPVQGVIHKSALGSAKRSSHGSQIRSSWLGMSKTVPATSNSRSVLKSWRHKGLQNWYFAISSLEH